MSNSCRYYLLCIPPMLAVAGFLNFTASAQSGLAAPAPVGTVVLREGSEVKLRFIEPISSKTAAIDDPVTLELSDDIRVGDVIVARIGAKARGKTFPNVYVDFCWAHIVSPSAARRAMHEFLETVPVNKIFGYGGDYRFPELSYGHLQIAKEDITQVLGEKVEAGFCSEEESVEIAGMLLRENALRLFGAKAKG